MDQLINVSEFCANQPGPDVEVEPYKSIIVMCNFLGESIFEDPNAMTPNPEDLEDFLQKLFLS